MRDEKSTDVAVEVDKLDISIGESGMDIEQILSKEQGGILQSIRDEEYSNPHSPNNPEDNLNSGQHLRGRINYKGKDEIFRTYHYDREDRN